MTKTSLSDLVKTTQDSANSKHKRFLFLHWLLLLASLGAGGWATVLQQAETPARLLTAVLAATTAGLAAIANQTSFKKKYRSYRAAKAKLSNLILDIGRHPGDSAPDDLIDRLQAITLELAAGTDVG